MSSECPSSKLVLPISKEGCVILGPAIRPHNDNNKSDTPSVNTVWRGCATSPEKARAVGGLRPRGRTASLFSHTTAWSQGHEAYVSTSSDRQVACCRVEYYYHGQGWVYKIAVASNMVAVEATLLQHSPHPEEMEFSALGGIAFDQIISWTPYTEGVEGKEVLNPDYNPEKYKGQRSSGAQFHLAGFPPKHEAWDLGPWSQLAVTEMSDKIVALLPKDEVVPVVSDHDPFFYDDEVCPEDEATDDQVTENNNIFSFWTDEPVDWTWEEMDAAMIVVNV